ncbi:MAG: hypothetical protein KAW88_01795 [Candidatus Cloacimonetes bacterium]|nr:hypothetical protein [Candidatus Cloacimonadota bacterium]
MYKDPILKEKWKTQKRLAKEANYDIQKLIDNAKKNVSEMAKGLNIKLKISNRKGCYIS